MKKRNREFTVTEDHIKLLKRAYIDWEDCEFGAPAIDCKRPYGNSSVFVDIAEILGIPLPAEDGEFTDAQCDQMRTIHEETMYALQIFLDTGEMKPGRYKLPENRYGKGWQKIG